MPNSVSRILTTNPTNLSNARITEKIAQMTPKLVELFAQRNALATRSRLPAPETLFATITALLHSPNGMPISLAQLNANYSALLNTTYTHKTVNLITPPGDATEQDLRNLASIACQHIEAIVDGYSLNTENTNTTTFARPQRNTTRQHHHHYHGCRDNFWRDMMFYQLLFNNSNRNYASYPSSSTSSNDSNKDQVSWAGILLAICMVGSALATIGYDVMQTYYRLEEICHGEDLIGNGTKLAATGVAAWLGYLVGAMIGAGCFANPILGGICLAIVSASTGMAAAKWAIGKWHESNEHNSALASDPRFCLTEKEKSKLIQLGINPNVAKEVLRECAISIENETTNGLIFWQNPHQELIEIARKIKSGKIEEIISMNATHKDELGEKHTITKEFHLKAPFQTTAAINISLTEPTATPIQSLNSEKIPVAYAQPMA